MTSLPIKSGNFALDINHIINLNHFLRNLAGDVSKQLDTFEVSLMG